jgi:hypothetical protein
VTNPWDGPRYRSWASNTVLTLILLLVCLVVTATVDHFGEPPNYLVGLLGTAAGAFFTAIGSDKNKREAEDREYDRREIERRMGRSEKRADDAEDRESGWSQHRNHHDTGDGGT